MASEFKTPDPGEGIHEVEIVELHVAEGDSVSEGDTLMAVESDKATVDVPSSFSGTIASIEVAEGDVVEVGDVLLTYETGDGGEQDKGAKSAGKRSEDDKSGGRKAERKAERKKHEAAEAEDSDEAAEESASSAAADVEASPATRRLARELDIDLAEVSGSGPGGRVLGRDVRRAVRRRGGSAGDPRRATTLPDPARWGEVSREPLRGIRRATARHMAESWATIPHVSHTETADVTELEAFRREHADELDAKLTLTVLVVKALAAALRRYPRFNASLDPQTDEIVYKHYCHVGVAVATDDGLLVPVLRDVDRKSLRELAAELEALGEAARNRKLEAEDMKGGCISVTNVGGIGGDHFTPIINLPEAAILGVGAMREEPAFVRGDDGERRLDARLRLPLILGFDHRLNDGMDAARFAGAVAQALADPETLLLAS